jgi:hypothetical protein
MAGTTVTGIPYPDDTDPVQAGAKNIRDVANAVTNRPGTFVAGTRGAKWTLPPAGYAPPGYRMTSDGYVHLEGNLQANAVVNNNDPVLTGLPVPVPAFQQDMAAINTGQTIVLRLKIDATGALLKAGGSVNSGDMIGIQGLCYYAGK